MLFFFDLLDHMEKRFAQSQKQAVQRDEKA